MDGQGIIKGHTPVTEWPESKIIIWKTPVPGRFRWKDLHNHCG